MSINRGVDKEDMGCVCVCVCVMEYIIPYTYIMEYYSAIKKSENNGTCSNMDGPRDFHAKWSKSDRDKYVISLNMRNLF